MKSIAQTKAGLLPVFALPLLLAACGKQSNDLTVTVQNDQDFNRKEVVSVSHEQLDAILKDNPEKNLRVKKQGSTDYLPVQWIDYDGDGKNDELLFQAEVGANGSSAYEIVADSTVAMPETKAIAYSRFVPERTDDYAWENDKVAFRMYGPTGEKEAMEGVPGSTMSSGVDVWLKRVDYPIINKWYKIAEKEPDYYHTDHGEGYDPYHVGNSRGTGGIGIWDNDSILVSRNYTAYRTLAAGPLRTVFELDYAPWSPYGVHETKRVTLDLGSNFSKFQIKLSSDKKVPNYAVGITLHENKGEPEVNAKEGWIRHWEQIDDAYVGEGIVMNPEVVDSAFARVSPVPEQSNLLIITKPEDTLTYYAGFAWQKAGQVTNAADWDAMLKQQAQILAHPLKVTVSDKK